MCKFVRFNLVKVCTGVSWMQQQTVWTLMYDLRTIDSYEQIIFNESVQKFHKSLCPCTDCMTLTPIFTHQQYIF